MGKNDHCGHTTETELLHRMTVLWEKNDHCGHTTKTELLHRTTMLWGVSKLVLYAQSTGTVTSGRCVMEENGT